MKIDQILNWLEEEEASARRWSDDDSAGALACDYFAATRLELERLREENTAFRDQFAMTDEIRKVFAHWDGTYNALPGGWVHLQGETFSNDDLDASIQTALSMAESMTGTPLGNACSHLASEIKRLQGENDELHDDVMRLLNERNAESALADQLAEALRAVRHDRPTAHTDNVWTAINQALEIHEEARREQ
jgi:hypothetical protein